LKQTIHDFIFALRLLKTHSMLRACQRPLKGPKGHERPYKAFLLRPEKASLKRLLRP